MEGRKTNTLVPTTGAVIFGMTCELGKSQRDRQNTGYAANPTSCG